LTPAPAIEEQERPYGENFEQLPEQLVNALRECVKDFQGNEKYLRRQEVRRDWKNRLYEVGQQHVIWQGGQGGGGFIGVTPGGRANNLMGGLSQAPNYVDAYNLYRPYLRVNLSVLTQNPPGIKFDPIEQERQEDQEAANTAEGYRHIYDRANNVKAVQMKIARMMGLSGRVVAWTHTEPNAQKFGLNPDGSPRQMETTDVYGTIETKVPILARNQDDCLYVFISDDPDVRWAKADYAKFPEIADKIKPGMSGLGESAYERLARLNVLQGSRSEMSSADAYSHLVARMRCWLRPEVFSDEKMKQRLDEQADGSMAATVGDRLNELFPEGCCVTFIGDIYAGAYPQSMDDAIVIGFPSEGEGMSRPGFMDSFLVIQDAFNDARNTTREIWDTGFPSTWIGADDQEFDAISKQRADPYAIRQKKLPMPTSRMEDSFFREPNPELPATFIEDMQQLQGELPQFMLAAPPALFGASMEDQKTASGYAQARAQAMGQQGTIWMPMQWMFARIYFQAALLATKNPDYAKPIAVPGGSGATATIEIAKMTKGQFGCYPDEDSSFPESTEAKRATLDKILATIGDSEIGMEMMQSPRNFETFMELNGFPELVSQRAQSWKKQMFEIEQLLKTSPIPPDPAQSEAVDMEHAAAAIQAQEMGAPEPPYQPAQPESTVPVQDWDFHQWEAAACQDWLNSEDCRRQLGNGNQAGVDNVVLHWKQHVAAGAAMMAAAMPPPAESPAGEPKGDSKKPPEQKPGAMAPGLPEIPGATATM